VWRRNYATFEGILAQRNVDLTDLRRPG
jgi:hypothetical protein